MGPVKHGRCTMKSPALPLLLATIALLIGCSQDIVYKGPGRLINNGWWDPHFHYVVELGTLDLTKQSSTTYRFTGLPQGHYVIGLQIPYPADKGGAPDSALVADVAMQLMRVGQGQVLIITGPLRSLNWSADQKSASAFVFRHDLYESYFDANPGETYELRVDINTPDPSIPPGTKMVLKSGGWK
jgi:hypothetical protein